MYKFNNFIDIETDTLCKDPEIINKRIELKLELIKNMEKLELEKIYIYEDSFDTVTLILLDDLKKWDTRLKLKTRDSKGYDDYMARGYSLTDKQISIISNSLEKNNIDFSREHFPIIKIAH